MDIIMLKQILDKRRRILVHGLTLLICILTILLIILPDGIVIPKEALELFRTGEYSQAAAFCEEKDFEKLSGFTVLCDAFREDAEGKCRDAKESLEQWDKLQNSQRFALPGDIQNQIVVLRRKIEKDYLKLLYKEREENRRKRIWKETLSDGKRAMDSVRARWGRKRQISDGLQQAYRIHGT